MTSTKFVIEQLKKDRPQAIILFGSAARGAMHKDSDLDILIIKKTKKEYFDRVREARFKVSTTVPLDIIVLTPEEARELPKKNSFFAQIIREGKLLYGKL